MCIINWNVLSFFFDGNIILGINLKDFIFLMQHLNQQNKANPMAKKSVPSSCLWEDPPNITDLSKAQENPISDYHRYWHQNRQNRLLDSYNYLLASLQPQEVIQHLDEILTDHRSTVFKMISTQHSSNTEWQKLSYQKSLIAW